MSDTIAVPPAEERGPGLAAPLALDPLSPFAAIMPIVVAIAIMTTPTPALWTLGAALSLFLLTGLLAGPQDLLRAMVAHLRVPYRVAYAGVAALGFRERFAIEYRVIQEAHDLRGTRAPLPLLRPLVRRWTAVPALMAGAVRHAERVSMSMDARGFGAYRHRTERSTPRWRWRDTLLVLVCWTLAAAIVVRFGGDGLVLHDV